MRKEDLRFKTLMNDIFLPKVNKNGRVGVWGRLSDGGKVPIDAEAVQHLVEKGRGKQIDPEWLGNLPGRWIRCRDGVKLPFDKTAREVALGLGWEHLVCRKAIYYLPDK